MSHRSFKVGRLTCHALEGGMQRLDGGAMFGVVPKPLWQRRIPADERNRIPLALRCLLVEHDAGLVLVDTGLGNKEGDKFKDIYGVANEGKDGRTRLEDALAELGYGPAEVRWVIDTHLHFDHAGGNTYRDPSGRVLAYGKLAQRAASIVLAHEALPKKPSQYGLIGTSPLHRAIGDSLRQLRSARNRADYDDRLDRPRALAQFAVRRARQVMGQLEALAPAPPAPHDVRGSAGTASAPEASGPVDR